MRGEGEGQNAKKKFESKINTGFVFRVSKLVKKTHFPLFFGPLLSSEKIAILFKKVNFMYTVATFILLANSN